MVATPSLQLGYYPADTLGMNNLNLVSLLLVFSLCVILYVMRRRTRLGRRKASF